MPQPPSPTVLVVAHGSRSARWVAAQEQWFAGVRALLEARKLGSADVRLSFLEITEPLFEDAVARAHRDGKPLIVFPFFLSRSGHVAEDIPEAIEQAAAGADACVLDTSDKNARLGANAARRLRAAGARPGDPVVVSAYGSSGATGEWERLVEEVRTHAGEFAQAPWVFAPAGHFLEDYGAPLREALVALQAEGHQRLAVLPLYLAVSSYQETLIPGVIAEFPDLHIDFQPDAILPDPELEAWAADRIAAALAGPTPPTPQAAHRH